VGALRRSPEWLWLALLLSIITLTWCAHYNRWTKESWGTPPLLISDERWARWKAAFGGDALWGMAATKATVAGEIGFFSKTPASLGAPFTANWNDWVTPEEGVAGWWAFLARIFGLFTGTNLALLSAHLLAGVSFFVVCRYFGYAAPLALAGAVLFALSRYAFWRALPHLGLVMYWHIPLGFIVLWWCLRGERILEDTRKLLFCLGVAFIHGIQSPYYAGMFLQLLAGGTVCAIIRTRDWSKALPAILIAFTLVSTFLFMTVETIFHQLVHGPNAAAVARSYLDVELWSLKPVELLVPVTHSIARLEAWANAAYYERTIILGEGGSPYLGAIALLSLGWLLWHAIKGYANQNLKQIPLHFWCVLWVLAYSVIGGMTGMLGLWNIFLFRATNRYSIFLFAVALLFLVKQLTIHTRKWRTEAVFGLSALIIAVGIFDQVPPRRRKHEQATRTMIKEDRKLVAKIESKLPVGAMIFQLPVMDFPEAFAIKKMTDYEPLRPYLHSKWLRFSYGNNKGRYRDRWQREADQLGAAGLVRKLEQYGFSAILINLKGYEDPTSPQENFRAAGRSHVLARSQDYVCIELNPKRRPSLPPEFGAGWHSLEGDSEENLRWSSGDATLVLHNPEARKRSARVRFNLVAFNRRYVEISTGNRTLYHTVLEPDDPSPVLLDLKLRPGENELRFTTDRPGESPQNGDSRMLAFAVTNFKSSR